MSRGPLVLAECDHRSGVCQHIALARLQRTSASRRCNPRRGGYSCRCCPTIKRRYKALGKAIRFAGLHNSSRATSDPISGVDRRSILPQLTSATKICVPIDVLTDESWPRYCDHTFQPPLLVRSTAVTAMSNSVIESVELFHVVLPPRREHKWTGATEPIGGYLLVKLIAQDGSCGWGECTALKEWAGEHGRYHGGSA